MVELAGNPKISESKTPLLNQTETGNIPAEVWREGVGHWWAINQVRPVVLALLRARDKIEALQRQGNTDANSFYVIRSLCTLAYAPFILNGAKILESLAVILGGNPAEPAALLNRYIECVASGDKETLERVDKCIVNDSLWREWFDKLAKEGRAFPLYPG